MKEQKKQYVKPTLVKGQKLADVTAQVASGHVTNDVR